MGKIALFILALFITIILSICFYFGLFILISIYVKHNSNPEHPPMMIMAAIFAFVVTIPVSLFILYKMYRLLWKKYGDSKT